MEIVKDLPDNIFDLVLIDVPYGVEFSNNKFYDDSKDTVFSSHERWLEEIARLLKEKHHCYIFIPTLEVDRWVSAVKKHFQFKNLIATKVYTTNRYLKDNFSFDLQLIIYCSKGKAKRLNRVDYIPTSSVWFKDKRNPDPKPYTYQYTSFISNIKANIKSNDIIKKTHPNQKSEEICKFLIDLSSNEGDIVADFFCGSGTTLAVAKRLNRNWFGTEINKEFYNLAIQRLNETKLDNIYKIKAKISKTFQTRLF